MTEDQLQQARKIKMTITTVEKTLERVDSLRLSWAANGTHYCFNKIELGEITELIDMFNDVEEAARTLLQKRLEKQLKKLSNEFEKL